MIHGIECLAKINEQGHTGHFLAKCHLDVINTFKEAEIVLCPDRKPDCMSLINCLDSRCDFTWAADNDSRILERADRFEIGL